MIGGRPRPNNAHSMAEITSYSRIEHLYRRPFEFVKRDRFLLVVLTLSLIVHLAILGDASPWDLSKAESVLLQADAREYHYSAVGIASGDGLDAISPARTPGYSVFLGGFYVIFGGDNIWIPLIVQILINLTILLIVYKMAFLVTGQIRIARATSVLFGLSFISTFYATRILSETLFTLILLVVIISFVKGIQTKSIVLIGVSGTLLGIATLIRPITQFYAVVPIIILIFSIGGGFKKISVAIIVFAVCNFLILAPWFSHNQVKWGHFQLTTLQGQNALDYQASHTRSRVEGITVTEARERFSADIGEIENPFDRSARQMQEAVKYSIRHPIATGIVMLQGSIRMLAGTGQNIVVNEILHIQKAEEPDSNQGIQGRITGIVKSSPPSLAVALLLVLKLLAEYSLMLVGGLLLVQRRSWLWLAVLVGTVVYFVMVAGPLGDARFRVPLIPLFAIVSGIGYVWAAEKVRAFR